MKYDHDDIFLIILIVAFLLILFNMIMFAHVFDAIEELKQML